MQTWNGFRDHFKTLEMNTGTQPDGVVATMIRAAAPALVDDLRRPPFSFPLSSLVYSSSRMRPIGEAIAEAFECARGAEDYEDLAMAAEKLAAAAQALQWEAEQADLEASEYPAYPHAAE